ncbi:MAG: energy transducer TonB [Bacteroidia bacterium]|nr:energy transducer TonB [Bacteroidia bacterium]
MKVKLMFLVLLLCYVNAFSQEQQIKFYKNSNCTKEVAETKASFSKRTWVTEDSCSMVEVKDIRTGEVVSRTGFKGEEPFGIWVVQTSRGLKEFNYDFELKSSENTCTGDTAFPVKNPMINDDSLSYIAPVMEGNYTDLMDFVRLNTQYPMVAIENGYSGKSYISFVLGADAKIRDVMIRRSSGHIVLDKEAARVVRELKFSKGAIYMGKKVGFCFNLPVAFQLR